MSLERLTDGKLETWTSATDLTNWTEALAGSSTVNREATTIHGGIYSCRFDVDASNSVVYIYQTAFSLIPLKRNKIVIWYENSASGKTSQFQVTDNAINVYLKPDGTWTVANTWIELPNSTTWKKYGLEFYAHADYSTYRIYLNRKTAASSSIYFDDVSVLETHNGKDGLFMGLGMSIV